MFPSSRSLHGTMLRKQTQCPLLLWLSLLVCVHYASLENTLAALELCSVLLTLFRCRFRSLFVNRPFVLVVTWTRPYLAWNFESPSPGFHAQRDRSGTQHPEARAVLYANESNSRIIKAVLCAGFYPNVVRVKHPEAKYVKTEGGAVLKVRLARALALWCC